MFRRAFANLDAPVFVAAIATAAFVLAAGVAMAVYENQLYIAQNRRDASEQAQVLAASVEAAAYFGDNQAAQEYVNALKVNPEIEAAGVYDSQGRAMARYQRSSGDAMSGRLSELPVGREGDYLNLMTPIMQGRAQVGTVYLRTEIEPAQREILRYAGIALLLVMGALVLGVISMSQRALTRANAELASRARDLSFANMRLQTEMEERRKTEEALRQSQKMEAIGQLSGGIAHDFNNLLTIIKGNLQLLRRRLAQGKPGHARYIDDADEGLNRAARLTQRILAFSRQQPLSPKSVQLNSLIEGMADLIRQSAGEAVEIRTDLKAKWRTLCDANQMENVILNLAINARDAMPDGGRITIETRDREGITEFGVEDFTPGDYVELTMRDTGTGMADEVRRRAVDPFFTTKPLGQGTGLGLSMTFGYVRQSNGYLRIDSKTGMGTSIVILMPRHAAMQQA